MTRWIKTGAILAALAGLAAEPAMAARIALSRQSRVVSDLEIAGGAPAGGLVHEFFVTTDSDLLTIAVDFDVLDVPVYRYSGASQRSAPDPEVVAANPAAGASSFITTPGDTIMLGGGFDGTGAERGWGDLSNDGPQQNFRFAQLTVGQTSTFSGRIDVRGYGDDPAVAHYGFTSLPFSFALPGSLDELGVLGAEPTFSLEYSLEPPPVVVPPVVETPPITPPATLPDPPQVNPQPPVVVIPPVEPPALPSEPVEIIPPNGTPPGEIVEPPFGEPFEIVDLIDLPRLVSLVDLRAIIDGRMQSGGLQYYFANQVVVLNGASNDLAASGDFSLVRFAALDGDAATATNALAMAYGNTISAAVAADAGSHIPEPATASLLAMVAFGVGAFRRLREPR